MGPSKRELFELRVALRQALGDADMDRTDWPALHASIVQRLGRRPIIFPKTSAIGITDEES
jgi:hypothetical protein